MFDIHVPVRTGGARSSKADKVPWICIEERAGLVAGEIRHCILPCRSRKMSGLDWIYIRETDCVSRVFLALAWRVLQRASFLRPDDSNLGEHHLNGVQVRLGLEGLDFLRVCGRIGREQSGVGESKSALVCVLTRVATASSTRLFLAMNSSRRVAASRAPPCFALWLLRPPVYVGCGASAVFVLSRARVSCASGPGPEQSAPPPRPSVPGGTCGRIPRSRC